MKQITTISFIGSGNVATHLAKSFYQSGLTVHQVFSKHIENAEVLANAVNAIPINNLSAVHGNVDCIIIAVPDDAIATIMSLLSPLNTLLVHTSGMGDVSFAGVDKTGYFYPLQSFRKDIPLNIRETPIFIDANHEEERNKLKYLAELISENVLQISLLQKQQLHLSAVIVNNFVNHLFGLTNEYLHQQGLNFMYLKPIIETTVHRALTEEPFKIQTGPAKRNDQTTIQQHLKLLNYSPKFQKVYIELTKSIQEQYKDENSTL